MLCCCPYCHLHDEYVESTKRIELGCDGRLWNTLERSPGERNLI